jgi:ATP-binding cassette subfamily B protein
MDCGPTCLLMVAKYYGRYHNVDSIKEIAGYSKSGVSLLGISDAAEKIGFRSRAVQLNFDQLRDNAHLPCILHWGQNHFVVLISIKNRLFSRSTSILIADPAKGIIAYNLDEFLSQWLATNNEIGESFGIALLLEPTPEFYKLEGEKENKLNWGLVLQYFQQSRWKIIQIFIALLITSFLQLIFPFLTQSIVDTGISTGNLKYITIVLIAQLMLVFSRTIVDFIRSRLLLYVSSHINLSILSDFWIKLTKLPISYFDSHHTGDTLQRIGDHKQIEEFLTGTALNTLFSLFNLLIFLVVLGQYNLNLLFVFTVGSILNFLWIQIFLRIRRKINYQTFHFSAKENNATLQLVQGMQEIKLHNAEKLKRWEWENVQASIFKLTFKSLTYSQIQQAGVLLINQGKDILITFLVADLVINGKLTLGAMLAIQYIIGQLSSPIEQFVGFLQSAQDAKISMERLNEIHQLKDEEKSETNYIKQLPENKSIFFYNVSFSYPGSGTEPVLKNINLHIQEGKVTAIVGVSGSGKTTLLKLLLKFYDSYKGEIKIGETNYKNINPSFWRNQCGAVLQDGFIFNNSIAQNIALGDEVIDFIKLVHCCKKANILSFIESLPNGFYTKLGSEGIGMSQGQKQRLLIARAIYKNPQYLFFDEATNALDANNEKAIVENLQEYFYGRTVIIVAHRLSTVRNADKIILIDEGNITEEGTHEELCLIRGKYFELVRNQLELGL